MKKILRIELDYTDIDKNCSEIIKELLENILLPEETLNRIKSINISFMKERVNEGENKEG